MTQPYQPPSQPNTPPQPPMHGHTTVAPGPQMPPQGPHYNYNQTPTKKSGGFLKILMVMFLLLIFSGGALIVGVLIGTMFGEGIQTTNPNLAYSTLEDGDSANKIAVIRVTGVITPATAEYVKLAVDDVIPNEKIKAVILRVESGGGMVSPSDEILYHFKRLKAERPNITVVSSFGGIAASGGYYIAMASDHIMAEKTGITGSIGVMSQTFTFKGTLEKLGVTSHVITAGADKDTANNPFRDWTDKDIKKIRKIIDPMHQTFIDRVYEGRGDKLSMEEVKELATGDVWIAEDAERVKLIDSIGYLDNAIALVRETISVSDAQVVEITRAPTLGDILFGGASHAGVNQDPGTVGMQQMMKGMNATEVRQFINEMSTPQMLYMYQP